MMTVNPYLNFNGNCEEAFNFYKSVFGGEFTYLGRFNEMPMQEGMPPLPENEGNRIMHVTLPIGGDTVLMGSDTISISGNVSIGNNISMSVNASSREEADSLFSRLSEGGKIIMPLSDTFWNAYFGIFTDKFGINWMVNFDL
ncbi:MAG: VOC family protein [Deltaproteobacteria bacterium]